MNFFAISWVCLNLFLFGVEKTIALGPIHNHRNQRQLLYSTIAGSFGLKIIFCVREPENGLKGELLLDCSPLTWTSKEETCMQNS